MTRLLIACTVLIFLTTGCGVLTGDVPTATAPPAPTPTLPPPKVIPPRTRPVPQLPAASPSIEPPLETRTAPPAKPSVVPPTLPTRTAPPTLMPTVLASPQPAGAPNTYWVTNPTTNARLYVQVFAPQDAGKKYPALVLVPGGIADSSAFIDDAAQMTRAGIVALAFDPDGRGKSEGKEDYDGHKQQDGLAAVIRFAATLPNVDASKIGVATYSYGITMGSGTLARYSDLPVKFLMDWEGPANRNYTSACKPAGGKGGKIAWQPCSDNAWWSEREAVNFIGKLRVPYQRIQSEKDHVQPTNAHAVDMINAAIKGGVPWVRLNDYPPNQTYDPKAPPQMFPEQMDRQLAQTVIRYAQELFKR